MGRPKTGTNNKLERVLTRVICQEVYLASGLPMAELESLFDIGTTDAFGRKTSKTLGRYIESDPAKSRSAPRDVLQRIVRTSIENGWLTSDQICSWNLHDVLALDYKSAASAFELRKKERDALVKSLRELRAAAQKTNALVSSSSSIWLAMSTSAEDPLLAKRQELVDFLDDVAPGLSECVVPNSIPRTLDLLERLLDQSLVVFRRGRESVPVIDPSTLAIAAATKGETVAPNSLTKHTDVDFTDLDDLLKLIENSMK